MSDKLTDLELLKQQRREIDAKIKALQNKTVQYGVAKICTESFYSPYGQKYSVSVRTSHYPNGKSRWQTIVTSLGSRRAVVEAIPDIINSLTQLYEAEKGDADG